METLFTIVWVLSFLIVTAIQFTGGRVARWVRKNDKELATKWGLVYDRWGGNKVETRSLIYRDLMTDRGLSFALLTGLVSFVYPIVIPVDLFRLYVWPHVLSSYDKFSSGADKLFDRFMGMLVGILKEEPPVDGRVSVMTGPVDYANSLDATLDGRLRMNRYIIVSNDTVLTMPFIRKAIKRYFELREAITEVSPWYFFLFPHPSGVFSLKGEESNGRTEFTIERYSDL